MTQLQKITPYCWFDNQAEQAADLYVSLFPNSRVLDSQRTSSDTGEGGAIVEFELDGQRMTAFDGGPIYSLTPAVSFVVSCETQAEIDHYWHGLSEGGEQQPCGWLLDQFGLSWQVVPAELPKLIALAPEPVMTALLQMSKIEIAPSVQPPTNADPADPTSRSSPLASHPPTRSAGCLDQRLLSIRPRSCWS